MGIVKFDVSGSDPDRATQSFEPPKPGVYRAKVAELNSGFAKSRETGKPDPKRPRLEVVYHLLDDPYKNAPLWDYLSFSEEAQWKMDQFLQAVGIASKKKRKGSFDSDSLIGKIVKVRVRGGKNLSDEYRAEVGGVMAAPDEDEDYGDSGEGDEGEGDIDGDKGEGEDEVPADEPEEDPYESMTAVQLRTELKARELDPKGTSSAMRERLRENDAEQAEPPDDEAQAEDEAPDDGYDDLTLDELKQEVQDRELTVKPITKVKLIAALRENDLEPF